MTSPCPNCGEPKKHYTRYCMVCADDKVRARAWKKADVDRLVAAARAMTSVFRVYAERATDEERSAWVNLIDAVDRRQTGPSAFEDAA